MNNTNSLEEIRLQLEDLAFKKLEAAGLATLRPQVKLTIKVKLQVFSDEITGKDWEQLKHLDVGVRGQEVLERLKSSGNKPFDLFDCFGNWRDVETFKNHIRSHAAPIYIAQNRNLVCIKKRKL